MNKPKRQIKTPKRFEDEAFVSPPKQQTSKSEEAQHSSQRQEQALPQIITPAKNAIKFKLTSKPRNRVELKPQKEPLTPKEVPKIEETPKPKEISKLPKDTPRPPKEIANPKETTKPKSEATPKPTKYELHKLREPSKIREPAKLREPAKPREPTKPREITKPKEPPRVEIRPPDRELIPVFRPRNKRPRTPPIFTDITPNVVLPFWDARTAAEEHEDDNVKELVHCQCGIAEELGLMVQCEICLTWQHAHCLGIEKPEDAPDGYTCKACSDPRFARESRRWAYDQDWLTKGRMKRFSCDRNPPANTELLRMTNSLISQALKMHQLIHSLRIKTRILREADDDDPNLQLFRIQWPPSYQHHDGSSFMPTVDHPSSTPASTISAIDGDIAVETEVDVPLPDLGQLEDVSAILDSAAPMPSDLPMNSEAAPNDCRSNLKLHIHQTEEFIGIELAHIDEQLANLEKLAKQGGTCDASVTLDSLKNDLHAMREYITTNLQC